MHILLVNDDGIRSPWLAIVAEAAAARGHRVSVFAPAQQQSAKAHSFTLYEPLRGQPFDFPHADCAWAIEGTPPDCTRIGLLGGLIDRPDLVISGINNGLNTGFATWVSGTCGAAREAAFQGIPAMALSAEVGTPDDTLRWYAAQSIALGERLVKAERPAFGMLNVNCPPLPVSQVQGVRFCGISLTVYTDGYTHEVSPRGEHWFWCTPDDGSQDPTFESDLYLCRRGWITVSWLTPEMANTPGDEALIAGLYTVPEAQ